MPTQYYKPGLDDSVVNLDEMNKWQGAQPKGGPSQEDVLKKSGYVLYTPPAGGDAGAIDSTGIKSPSDMIGAGTADTGYSGIKSDAPKYTAPDTSQYDADIAKYAPVYDPDTIQKNLDADLNAIASKWDIERQTVKNQTENEKKSQISNLYGVGVVNPLSSGMTSIGTASTETLDKRLAAVNSAEAAEKAAAMAKAYGLKSSGASEALKFAQDKKKAAEEEAQTKYTYDRQAWEDGLTAVNNAVASVKAGQAVTKETQDQAQEGIKNMLASVSGGSANFEGIDANGLADLEKAAGYPKGYLSVALTAAKEKELLGQKVTVGKDGLFYTMKIDKNGIATMEPIGKMNIKATGGGAGGGGGNGSGLSPGSSGNGIVAGYKVPSDVANDVEAVLSGRNTLYNIRQTMGRTNAAAAYMQRMRDTISKIDPKFDYVASDAGGKLVSSSYYQRSIAAINSVLPNIDKVVSLSDEVSRIGVAGVDKQLQKAAIQVGNKKVANFKEAQQLIADEIGLALGQGTVSDMKLQLGFDITDTSVSKEVFASNLALVKEFVQNRKNGLNEMRYKSSVPDYSENRAIIGAGGGSVIAPDGQEIQITD